MTVYRIGSSGDQVKKIQQALGINADGVYGQQTRDAVRAYQKANNLQVDGEVGDETWGSLFPTQQNQRPAQQTTTQQYTAPNTSQQGSTPSYTPTNPKDYAYDPNTNEAYLNALKALEQANKNAPTYGASYDKQLEDLYYKIVNREDFSYDLNADALYEQYQQKFTALGDQAMQDTMGQAAALTGGYGSSYAQNAGQQAYNQYLTQLNDIVPDLYNQAYGRYQDEGQDLLNQYAMLGDKAEDEYGKYMDAYNQWLTQLQMSRDDVDTAYDRGYTDFINAQQMAYQKDQANIAYAQWQQEMAAQQQRWEQEMAYQRERDAIADSQWAQELAARNTNSGGGGSTKTTLTDAYNSPYGTTTGGIKSQKSNATSLDYSPDEGVFYWNGKAYASANHLLTDMETANLSSAEMDELRKKFAVYGFTLA